MVAIYEEKIKIIHSEFLIFLSSLQEKHIFNALVAFEGNLNTIMA